MTSGRTVQERSESASAAPGAGVTAAGPPEGAGACANALARYLRSVSAATHAKNSTVPTRMMASARRSIPIIAAFSSHPRQKPAQDGVEHVAEQDEEIDQRQGTQ